MNTVILKFSDTFIVVLLNSNILALQKTNASKAADGMAKSVNNDKTAPLRAVWSSSILYVSTRTLKNTFTLFFSLQFDIWSLIKRANTADPYVMMAKHRMSKSMPRRPKTAGHRLVRRRRASVEESSTEESLRSHTSTEMYDFEYPFADDYDFDGGF